MAKRVSVLGLVYVLQGEEKVLVVGVMAASTWVCLEGMDSGSLEWGGTLVTAVNTDGES